MSKVSRPVVAGLLVSRRRLLLSLAGLAAAQFSSFGSASATAGVRLAGRWPTGNRALAPFTLADGVLYIAGESSVEAWKPCTGQSLWRQRLDARAVFRPRLGDGVVLTAGRTHIAAWDRTDGRRRWRLVPERGVELGVPLVHEGRVHFGQGHRLVTVDAATGELLWEFPTTETSRIAYAPTASGDIILLGAGDGVLYALSAADGRLVWKVNREKDWQYLRQLHMHKRVIVAGGYLDEVYGISADDGRILWRFDAGNFVNSHLVAGGMVYFWSPTGWIYALDAETGERAWRHQTTDYGKGRRRRNWAPVMAELVADDRYLYVLAMDRVLHVLDRKTGSSAGDFRLPVSVRPFVCLASVPSRVILGSSKGEILCFDLA